MKEKRVMAMDDTLQWLDRRMELWGVTEKEKQDSEMENQDLITEEDGLHHINNKNKEQMKMNQQEEEEEEEEEEELQGMSFTYKPIHCLTMSPHLIFGIPCIPPEEEEETSWVCHNKNKEQMKMNQQQEEEEELQGMSFTYKPMHCLTRSPHLIFGIPSIPPEEEEETSWGIAGLGPRWLI